MASKLVKSLLLSGLGMIGLTITLLGVGKAVASQQRAELDAIATDFLTQFSVTQTNNSARELERLISRIRFGMTSMEPSETAAPVDEQKAELLETASGILSDYLARQA